MREIPFGGSAAVERENAVQNLADRIWFDNSGSEVVVEARGAVASYLFRRGEDDVAIIPADRGALDRVGSRTDLVNFLSRVLA